MAWTDTARTEHNRKTSRYPSDMLDREWALVFVVIIKIRNVPIFDAL